MTNTKFAILMAVIIAAAVGIVVAVFESNREPTPAEAAQQTVEYLQEAAEAIADKRQWAQTEIAKNEIRMIELALLTYQIGRESAPLPTLAVLAQTRESNGEIYFSGNLFDPWGNPYVIVPRGDGPQDYTIESMGPDGRPGTTDDLQMQDHGFLGE